MSKIPKIIHQTWKDENVPDKWKSSRDAWLRLFPDYSYMLWTDEMNRNFIEDRYPDLLEMYDGFPYNIQRADMIRYCILKTYGGIYCDLDIEPVSRDIEKYWSGGEDLYLVESSNTPTKLISYVSNFFMASSPECKFWDYVLDRVNNKSYITKHYTVYNTTGPSIVQLAKQDYPFTVGILPNKLFSPCNSSNSDLESESCYIEGSMVKQLPGMSWISFDTRIINFCVKYNKPILFLLVSILICLIYFSYKYISIRKNCEIICNK